MKFEIKRDLLLVIIIGIGLFIINQSITIYGGDGGDLVAAALVRGIAHPPGYPLYVFLGFIATKIPYSTPAWRVSLLSTIPSILSLVFFYLTLKLILKKSLTSLITTFILGVTYLFWLFSIVPEVFALNNFFIIILIYLIIKWFLSRQNLFFYLWILVLGFSLSHHHTIILMLPACFYLFFLRKSSLLSLSKLKILLLFSIGFIPYIYLPISASLKPPINWENPINLKNFIKLVTRANYGTFKVGSFVGDTMLQRFLSAAVAVRTIFRDIRFFGLIMFAAGIIYSLRKFKQISIFFLILFLTNILFIAYASFPLYNNFLVGTFERFLLFPIILIMYFIGFGIDFTTVYVAKFIREKVLHNKIKPLKMTAIISLTFLIIPFSYYYINYPQVKSFKSDLTQENMAEDILNSVDNKSILFSSIDTTLFSSFYVYYWKNRWENVALVHLQKLNDPFYRDFLKEKYSWLKFPEKEFSADAFIELNYKEVPVYFIELIPDLKGDLVPNGLVYRYYLDTKDIPDDNAIISINEKLWASYKDPKQGNLIRFNNLLNADLLRIYASGHEAYGIYLLTASKYDKAEKEFIKAVYYNTNPNYFDSKVNLGIAYFKEKKCNEAIKEFNEVYEKNKENINAVGMLIKSYKECEIDPVKASEYQKIFETLVNKQKTELEKL